MVFVIDDISDGITIEKYLKGLRFSKHQISRLKFKNRGIVLNGEQTRVTTVLRKGDLLELSLRKKYECSRQYGCGCEEEIRDGKYSHLEAEHPEAEHPEILYEDDFLMAVNKPQGIVCHPSHGHWGDTMADLVIKHLYRNNMKDDIEPEIYLAGRLDKDTSGVLLFAKDRETAALLAAQRAGGELKKTYVALCRGCFGERDPKNGQISLPVGKDPKYLNKMMITDDGKPAQTFYSVISSGIFMEAGSKEKCLTRSVSADNSAAADNSGERTSQKALMQKGDEVSLVKAEIIHGRTHQIRVHMASIGHPLLGDPIYGEDSTYADDSGRGETDARKNRDMIVKKRASVSAEIHACNSEADHKKSHNPVRKTGADDFAHLHAWKAVLKHPYNGRLMEIEAPMPEWVKMVTPVSSTQMGSPPPL